MVFCTEFLDGWWSWEQLRRLCVRCEWCRASHGTIRTVHTTYAAALKTTTNTSIKLSSCIKLAFHFISWGRCTVKQPSSKKGVFGSWLEQIIGFGGHHDALSNFHKLRGISWLAENLLRDPEEELCSTVLVILIVMTCEELQLWSSSWCYSCLLGVPLFLFFL